MTNLPWDFEDEPAIEERVDLAFTQEGRAVFHEAILLDQALQKVPKIELSFDYLLTEFQSL